MSREKQERPGMLLYFEEFLPALKRFNNEELGIILRAVIRYGAEGEEPELDGNLGFFFEIIKPKLDRDLEKYRQRSVNRSYAAYCSHTPPAEQLTRQEWEKLNGL